MVTNQRRISLKDFFVSLSDTAFSHVLGFLIKKELQSQALPLATELEAF